MTSFMDVPEVFGLIKSYLIKSFVWNCFAILCDRFSASGATVEVRTHSTAVFTNSLKSSKESKDRKDCKDGKYFKEDEVRWLKW